MSIIGKKDGRLFWPIPTNNTMKKHHRLSTVNGRIFAGNHLTAHRVLISLVAAMLCLCFFGCGRKEMPTAPRQVPPHPVTDLAAWASGNQVELKWSYSEALYGSEPINVFGVFRASEPISESCDNCPFLFKRVADIPTLDGQDGTIVLTYRDTLEKGYRYRYKVIGYSTAGIAGKDSNMVTVEGE